MKFIFIFLLLLVALMLQVTILQIPLVLVVLLCLTVTFQQEWMFPIAFVSGIFLDGLSFRPLGASSLLFLLCIFIVFLYQQKFELRTLSFIVSISFLGSAIYLFVFGAGNFLLELFLATGMSGLFYLCVSFFQKKLSSQALKYSEEFSV